DYNRCCPRMTSTVADSAVFISYAHEDESFVSSLVADLRKAGLQIWLDSLEIPVGLTWQRAVEDAINQSRWFVVVLSPASVQSLNVLAEVDHALDQEKPILPVLVKDCKRPFRIRAIQYADFTGDYWSGLAKLMAAIGPVVGPAAETETEAVVTTDDTVPTV